EGAIPNVSLHKSKLFALVLLAATVAGGAGLWASIPSATPAKNQRTALADKDDKKADEKREDVKERADARDEEKAPAAADLHATLNRRIDFKGFDDPSLTLGEALDHLGDKYGLQFDVNETAFAEEEAMDDTLMGVKPASVRETKIGATPLPALKTSLRKVLTKV